MRSIDLHTHSTASDGTHTPTELVRMAKEKDLAALALTDHDSVEGLPEAFAAGRELGVTVIGGCELSVVGRIQGLGEKPVKVHMVGLFLPEQPAALATLLADLRHHRHHRNELIVEKLQGLGVEINYDEVRVLAEGAVGRPHIARVLVAKGVVSSFQEAFDRFISDGGKAHVPKKVLPPDEAIASIKAEGGCAVLAHPGLLPLGRDEMDTLVYTLKGMGLDGIEAHYSEHTPSSTQQMLALAKRFDLAVSGGSDFHGFEVKPQISLGSGKGNLRVPETLLDDLRARAANAA